MQITPASLSVFFTACDTRFWTAYGTARVFYEDIASVILSGTEQNTYGWIGKLATMRQWVGERQLKNPGALSYTLVNLPYELTETIDKYKLLDDTYGVYAPIIERMGQAARKLPDYQLVEMLQSNSGAGPICVDKLNYFAGNHPVNPYDSTLSTYSNYDSSSFPLTNLNYQAARAQMMAYKGEDGKPLGLMPQTLIVPPQLEYIAKTIVGSSFIGVPQIGGQTGLVGTTENVLKDTAKVIVIPELAADATTWYLADCSLPIKPFLWQRRSPTEFVYRINPQDPHVFMLHEYIYGVEERGAPGVSMPWMCSKHVG